MNCPCVHVIKFSKSVLHLGSLTSDTACLHSVPLPGLSGTGAPKIFFTARKRAMIAPPTKCLRSRITARCPGVTGAARFAAPHRGDKPLRRGVRLSRVSRRLQGPQPFISYSRRVAIQRRPDSFLTRGGENAMSHAAEKTINGKYQRRIGIGASCKPAIFKRA